MARRVRNGSLESATARAKLPCSDVPEWQVIAPGLRLGYRRGVRGGTWLAACRLEDGARKQEKLGRADDALEADGTDALSFWQAQDAARAWFVAVRRTTDQGLTTGPFTVNNALDGYLAERSAAGMKSIKPARQWAALHIRPALGDVVAAKLTAERIRRWHHALASSPRFTRGAAGQGARPLEARTDPDAVRARRDTANRVLTLLRAALNWAWREGKVSDDGAWRRVRPFEGVEKARVRFLSLEEQQRLLRACEGGLRDLAAAALLTGCRYGELARLQVRDFHREEGLLFVAESKSGRARHVPLTAEGVELFDRLAAGKRPDEVLLRQDGGAPWARSSARRPWLTAVSRAGLEAITLHELRHTYASTLLKAGVPLMIVAEALGHADTRMAERHYAHLTKEHVYSAIRAGVAQLGLASGNLVRLTAPATTAR